MNTPDVAGGRGKPAGLTATLYRRFQQVTAALESPFLLLIRLYWGWQFTMTGWGKLQHLSRVGHYFSSLGLPVPGATAAFVSGLELVGGLLLIAGLGTRLVGLLLAGDMLVAYLVADRTALASIISDPGRFYGADPYTFLFAALVALILGAGRFSLDYFLWRRGGC